MAKHYRGNDGPRDLDTKYLIATKDKYNTTMWYSVPDSRHIEYPQKNRNTGEWDVAKDTNYAGGDSGLGRGVLYKNTQRYLFKGITDSDDKNAYANSGKNNKTNVKNIVTPMGYSVNNPDGTNKYNYLYRDQHGSPHVFKVFKKNGKDKGCEGYYTNTKNIRQKCMDKLWKDEKCTTKSLYTTSKHKKSKLKDIKDGAKVWGKGANARHRLGCWNYDKKDLGTGECKGSSKDSKDMSQKCLDQIWTNAGCSTKNIYKKSGEQDMNWYKNDSAAWSRLDTDRHRLGCHNRHTKKTCCDKENILLQTCSYMNNTQLKRLGVLEFNYYKGSAYPPTTQPILTEYQGDISLQNKDPKGVADYFTTIITGYISFPEKKEYRFNMTSDDHGKLYINDKEIIHNSRYTPTANKSKYTTYEAKTYKFKAYVVEKTGGSGIKIKINSKSLGEEFINIPKSWLSCNFTLDLYNARNVGIEKACGSNPNWSTTQACIDSIENSTVILNQFADKIVQKCTKLSNSDIQKDKACKPFFTSSSENNKIQKAFCKKNHNYLFDAKCDKILSLDEKKKVFNNYCLNSGGYKSKYYNKCNDFYTNNKLNDLKEKVKKDCAGENAFNKSCTSMGGKDSHKSDITKAVDTYCKTGLDSDAKNMNTTNCTNYASKNIHKYNEILTSYCEKDLKNLEKNVCKKLYTDNIKDTVVSKSNKYNNLQLCLKDNKFTTDTNCTNLSKEEDNKKYFIENAANHCIDNMNSKYCTNFYKETVDDLKKSCKSTFDNKKENFDNYTYETNDYSNNIYLFIFMFILIIIMTCFYPRCKKHLYSSSSNNIQLSKPIVSNNT